MTTTSGLLNAHPLEKNATGRGPRIPERMNDQVARRRADAQTKMCAEIEPTSKLTSRYRRSMCPMSMNVLRGHHLRMKACEELEQTSSRLQIRM
jgi:hypothetical protein